VSLEIEGNTCMIDRRRMDCVLVLVTTAYSQYLHILRNIYDTVSTQINITLFKCFFFYIYFNPKILHSVPLTCFSILIYLFIYL